MIPLAIIAAETVALLLLGTYCLELRVRAKNGEDAKRAFLAERQARVRIEGLLCAGKGLM